MRVAPRGRLRHEARMNLLARERLVFVSLIAASATLAACGLFGSKDDEPESLSPAPPGPPSAAIPSAAGPQPLPTTGGAVGAGQVPVTGGGGGIKLDAGIPFDASIPFDGSFPFDAGKTDAAAPADGGAASTKLKACADKCQGIMATCLTPTIPTDGGLPQIKDPAACQAAANACKAACSP